MSGPSRRTWLAAAGAGGLALVAGAAWRLASQPPVPALPAPAPAGAGPLPQPVRTLDGRLLTEAGLQGQVVVLNFWAPWCPPCVREMPELDHFARSPAARGVTLIGMAIDEQPAVEKFLAAHPVGFPIAVLGVAGLQRARAFGPEGGAALPFTVVFDRTHRLVHTKFGPTDATELSGWVQAL